MNLSTFTATLCATFLLIVHLEAYAERREGSVDRRTGGETHGAPCDDTIRADYLALRKTLEKPLSDMMEALIGMMNKAKHRQSDAPEIQVMNRAGGETLAAMKQFRAKHAGRFYCRVVDENGERSAITSEELDSKIHDLQESLERIKP